VTDADPFDHPDDADLFDQLDEPEVKFDRWKRYVLPDPYTGQEHPWTRATTFARTITDSYALGMWQQRMVVRGLALRPELAAQAVGLDVVGDRERLDRLAEKAKDAAGAKTAADTGTAIHTFTEETDAGTMAVSEVPEVHRPGVEAYRHALSVVGLRVLPEFQERVICVPSYEVAGRLDKIAQEADGTHVIVDVKSGKLTYSELEISVQLAMYAHGFNTAGVWDKPSESWVRPDIRVREDYAIVAHMPAGAGTCTLYRVDIGAGWEAARLCDDVRDKRKAKGVFAPYEPPKPGA